jgi:hypothetical protein
LDPLFFKGGQGGSARLGFCSGDDFSDPARRVETSDAGRAQIVTEVCKIRNRPLYLFGSSKKSVMILVN